MSCGRSPDGEVQDLLPVGDKEVVEAVPGAGLNDAHDEQDHEDQVGEGGGEVDHLAAGLDPLAQADEHDDPGEQEVEAELHVQLSDVPKFSEARVSNLENSPLPILLL